MRKAKVSSESVKKVRPSLTPEARENQMISLAMDLVEQRLINGTASSQETTHFLKLGTAKEKLERERLEKENELLKAKTDAIKSAERTEELYKKAIKAMGIYSGNPINEDNNDDVDEEDIF